MISYCGDSPRVKRNNKIKNKKEGRGRQRRERWRSKKQKKLTWFRSGWFAWLWCLIPERCTSRTNRIPVPVKATLRRWARCSHCLKTSASKWLQSHNLRLGILFHESTEIQPEWNEQLVVPDLLTHFYFMTLCMLWVFAEGVRIDVLLQRCNPHIKFHAIICLKSEQRKVHMRGMFPLGGVADASDRRYITLEKVLFFPKHLK